MVLNCAGIAYYLESHASVIDRRLKGLSREDAEAVNQTKMGSLLKLYATRDSL